MTQQIPSIDDMPFLKARLGKARTDRVRYAGQQDAEPQKHAANIVNTIIEPMQYVSVHKPGCAVTDVLIGVATADTSNGGTPLSTRRLFNMFQCMPVINTRETMKMMDINKRQAQRYVRAFRIALPHISSLV